MHWHTGICTVINSLTKKEKRAFIIHCNIQFLTYVHAMRMHLIRRLFIKHIDRTMHIRWRFVSRNSIQHVSGYVFIIPSLYVQAYLKSNNSSINYIFSNEIVWGWCIQESFFVVVKGLLPLPWHEIFRCGGFNYSLACLPVTSPLPLECRVGRRKWYIFLLFFSSLNKIIL